MNGSITDRVAEAVKEQAERINQAPFADVIVRVQDGKPVLVEVISKHKVGAASHERHVAAADFGPDGSFRPQVSGHKHKPTV